MTRKRRADRQSATQSEHPKRHAARSWLAVFSLATFVAFSSAIDAPFLYDDLPGIRHNVTIRQLLPLSVPLNPPPNTPVSGRPVVNLTLAVNYAVNEVLGVDQNGRSATVGYHVFNILIHLLCGWLLFGVIRRTLDRPSPEGDRQLDPTLVAGFSTLLWLLHPIQTEAVDYLIQRTELLVSACYLGTLYASIRAWDADASSRKRWYVLAVVACLAGMASKEVMVTAPVIVVLYDRAFNVTSWKALLANPARLKLYGALFATTLIPIVSTAMGARGGAGFDQGVTWYQYFYSQAWAIARYLQLLAWPSGLTFDYGEHPITGASGIPGLLLLTACAVATIVAWSRQRWIGLGFLGAWFFLILAPSSSVVPIATEIAAERRIYLASAAVFVLAVIGMERLRSRRGFSLRSERIVLGALAVVLLAATYARGKTYASPETLYRDLIEKAPANPRAYVGLGLAMAESGPTRFAEATSEVRRALAIDSTYFVAWRTVGLLELMQGNSRAAMPALQRAMAMRPGSLDVTVGLARAHLALAQSDSAMKYADQIGSADVDLLWALGALLVEERRGMAALRYLEAAAAEGTPPARGLALLSVAYAQSARADEAVLAAQVATASAGDTASVFELAGRAMLTLRRTNEAHAYLRHALALDPGAGSARRALDSLAAKPR